MSADASENTPGIPSAVEVGTVAARRNLISWGPKLGIWAWSFVGVVAALTIIVLAVGTVSEIVLPLTFAAVLAVCFKPMARSLQRRGLKRSAAAGVVVLGLLALATVVAVGTVRGVTDQTAEISASVDAAIDKAVAELDADRASLETARASIEGAAPAVSGGFLTELSAGIDKVIGLASGLVLGALIMYYLLKDGSAIRKSVVARFGPTAREEVDGFIGDSCRILRDYGRGRTVMSAIVAVFIGIVALLLGLPLVFTIVVVNFVGGYIPYIGAFLGGGLAVIVALGEGGLDTAAIMLVVVVASNLLLENFVEPKVMSRSLDIHPLVVLVVTALGGLVGGIVGLILAVPAWVLTTNATTRLRRRGFFDRAVERAEPTVRAMLR
ncbi:AI-2E family transporter [Georgenia yuyongxinii]|uniref:AI-2E family transporter n=1 Tax=Georgenia yuyongxinii TaxID=2589797 RepID=A0A552WTP2_9MICO|nr:AI-2E family transporter [Georgenia yuyongxinii]TRW45693.1 AI-2E family transporter [Georgenia yuyongxinii]